MTGPEFSAELRRLGVSQRWFAHRAGTDASTVSRWCRAAEVPPRAASVLDLLRRLPLSELGALVSESRRVGRPKLRA